MAAPIRQAARAVAALDALTGLADVAASSGCCPPTITDGQGLQLEAAIPWWSNGWWKPPSPP